MVYTALFLVGLIGIAAQAVLGTSGHGHAGHGHAASGHGGHGHAADGHAGHGHGGHASNGHGNSAQGGRSARAASSAKSWMLDILSPLVLFSLAFGIGGTGLLLRPMRLVSPAHFALALLGGIVFYALLIKPIWAVIFQFASIPAKALDGAVAETAEALSHFDASGKGLVRVTVDGQLVRVLAYLDPNDRADEPPVQPGDQLTIISVDGRRNSCRVARL